MKEKPLRARVSQLFRRQVLPTLARFLPRPAAIGYPPVLDGKKVLVIMLTHIGDAVIHRFVIDGLSQSVGRGSVDLVVKPPVDQIFRGHTGLRTIYVFRCPWVGASTWRRGLLHWLRILVSLRTGNYDMTLVTHPHELSSLTARLSGARASMGWARADDHFLHLSLKVDGLCVHASEYGRMLLECLKIPPFSPRTKLDVSQKDYASGREMAKSLREKFGGSRLRIAAIHPGAGGDQKIWPFKNFVSVAEHLIQQGYAVLILGENKEKALCRAMTSLLQMHTRVANLCEHSLNLGQLAGVLAGSDIYLGNDSGPSHMAAALGIPSVVIFGPFSDPAVWAPRGPMVRVLRFGQEEFFSDSSIQIVRATLDEVSRRLSENSILSDLSNVNSDG